MFTVENNLGEYKTEIYSFIKTQTKEKLLVAPTGSGKTYIIIQFAKDNPHLKLALLCPTQSLVKNIGEDYKDVSCGFGSEFLDRNRFSDFIVTTYDSIETLENMDYIFIDEGHQIASDGSYRKVIAKILESDFKKVFISATPEIIEDYIPKTEESKLEFRMHRPQQEIKIFSGKYNIKGIISDIINNTKGLNKTILIRLNNKDTINNLKMGKISNVDVVLCTSIYDAGLSFKVDRDIQAYAVSQDTRKMPNPIDMVQFLARVRGNSGYKMDLTIIGNYGDYEMISMELPKYKSMQRLCNLMAHRYEEYREMYFGSYHYVLNRYNIDVTEITDLGFKTSKSIRSSRVSYMDIAQNFNSFSKEYSIVSSNLDNDEQRYQIELITGDKTLGGGSNARVQRVFNHFHYATKNEIPFKCFFNETYSVEVFDMLVKLREDYKNDADDLFSNMVYNIINPNGSVLNYKELGYKDLIQADAKVVRKVYNLF